MTSMRKLRALDRQWKRYRARYRGQGRDVIRTGNAYFRNRNRLHEHPRGGRTFTRAAVRRVRRGARS